MSTRALRLRKGPSPSTRVHGRWFADYKAIGDELADSLTRVGITDFVHFIWIEPDLALPAAYDRCCQTLLSTEVDPVQAKYELEWWF